MNHLQETGVGRTVNSLRKIEGEKGLGDAAKALVSKWKNMVMMEEEAERREKEESSGPSEEDVKKIKLIREAELERKKSQEKMKPNKVEQSDTKTDNISGFSPSSPARSNLEKSKYKDKENDKKRKYESSDNESTSKRSKYETSSKERNHSKYSRKPVNEGNIKVESDDERYSPEHVSEIKSVSNIHPSSKSNDKHNQKVSSSPHQKNNESKVDQKCRSNSSSSSFNHRPSKSSSSSSSSKHKSSSSNSEKKHSGKHKNELDADGINSQSGKDIFFTDNECFLLHMYYKIKL